MAICAPIPIADRITKALGLENCRSLKFSMEVGSAVAVVTEQYVSGNQLCLLAYELETKEWVLVPKTGLLTDDECAAIEMFAAIEWTSIRWSEVERHAATLRKLLERTK